MTTYTTGTRDEDKLPYPQAWVHRRDEYGAR